MIYDSSIKGCDSYFEIIFFKSLKVATNVHLLYFKQYVNLDSA